jgi:ABC-2 type transport system ATP-binding protein
MMAGPDPGAGGLDAPGDAIIIEKLERRFGDVKAVDGLDLAVREGELFGLLGPNGAGKTTTIKVLCGLLEPTGGRATVAGFDVRRDMDRIRGLIGVCPQEMGVFPYLTGRENVELFGDLAAVSREVLRGRVAQLLGKVSMTADADRRAKTYSGGMQRRVSLVMALVNDPKIAFLDEPTVGMDPQSRHAVWDFIKELKAGGKTVILTTHYMEEAEYLCDRVGIIDHGKIIALGTPRELMERHGSSDLEGVFLKLTGTRIRGAE